MLTRHPMEIEFAQLKPPAQRPEQLDGCLLSTNPAATTADEGLHVSPDIPPCFVAIHDPAVNLSIIDAMSCHRTIILNCRRSLWI